MAESSRADISVCHESSVHSLPKMYQPALQPPDKPVDSATPGQVMAGEKGELGQLLWRVMDTRSQLAVPRRQSAQNRGLLYYFPWHSCEVTGCTAGLHTSNIVMRACTPLTVRQGLLRGPAVCLQH